MLPMINGKQIIDCNLEDLQVIIDNPDYRENEYIDYKAMFSVDQYSKGDTKQAEKAAEFRSDICALANASGGYLFLGIAEEKGVPQCFCGIDIKDDNPDKFELRLKNYLQKIEPRIPNCRFRFIPLDNGKHIVIILVLHDAFAPYLHIDNQKGYRVYKRIGNDNRTIAYTELKRMFVQSVALEKEIEKFRKERIAYFREQGKERFMLVHIIPDTFVDSSYNQPVYVLNIQKNGELLKVFEPYRCATNAYPNADGFRAKGFDPHNNNNYSANMFNSMVAESFDGMNLITQLKGTDYLPLDPFWSPMRSCIDNYLRTMKSILNTNRVFVVISVIGCKGIGTSGKADDYGDRPQIDRDELFVPVFTFDGIDDDKANNRRLDRLKFELKLALGIQCGPISLQYLEDFKQ